MKKDIYEAPYASVINFSEEDIIRTSGDLGEWDELSTYTDPGRDPGRNPNR